MKTQLCYFDIYPKVVLNGKVIKVTIKPLGRHVLFDDEKQYKLHILRANDNYKGDGNTFIQDYKSKNGIIEIEYEFNGEQEYFIKIYNDKEQLVCDLSVYSVNKDLYDLRPYMGDLHVHSNFSDGKEAPEFVMAEYRKRGFDFATLTDHERYFPSIQAIQAYKDAPIDLLIVEGEEVHAYDNDVHILNFGGEFSVNEIYQNNKDKYYSQVDEILNKLALENNPRNFAYASCLWVFDKIKQAKGLSVFCHPHWISYSYQIPDEMIEKLFIDKNFDAFELIGGQSIQENNMQTSYYYNQKAKYNFDIPVVGNSDSHGCINSTWFNIAKTVVFAKQNEKQDIINAIKSGYSVAIENMGHDKYQCHGDYRLVAYARFLVNNYFPIHDELCFEEGRAMYDYINGVDGSLETLEFLQGRTKKLLDKYFKK